MKLEMNLKAICTLVTGMSVAAASAISITANTTVTEANVADYVAADIDIAAGATLTFSGLTTPRTFTGTLTGGGNFAVVSPATTAVKMTLAGDATGFTGQFCFTNHAVNVSSPAAVGDVARINLKVPQAISTGTDAYQCKFNPENATYRNFIDANVGANNGVMPAAGVTFAGPLRKRHRDRPDHEQRHHDVLPGRHEAARRRHVRKEWREPPGGWREPLH